MAGRKGRTVCTRVLRRQPHRRSGLATLPSVGAVPLSPHSIIIIIIIIIVECRPGAELQKNLTTILR